MVKKNDDNNDSKDLTRIEDLSEFLHQDDENLDSKFSHFESPHLESSGVQEISQLLDETPAHEPLPQDIEDLLSGSEESSDADTLSTDLSSDDGSSFFSESADTQSFEGTELESFEDLADVEIPVFEDSNESIDFKIDDVDESSGLEENHRPLYQDPPTEELETPEPGPLIEDIRVTPHESERFLDVKTFAQNFSYGKSSGVGGNPPYSLIARNIKYKEEADDILNILTELGLIQANNEKEINQSLELGVLLVPQISEYAAIVLAHKLRRFDLDLEVGLTDEVHPSKSGEVNPRGLIKKDNLRQNRYEREKISDYKININDILMTTSPHLPGFTVSEFLGVKSTFTIIEEAEIEKLHYVQKTLREHSPLVDVDVDVDDNNDSSMSSNKAFKDFNDTFILVYDDLLNQLKQKALTLNANALLGINYQVAPLHFDRAQKIVNAYQVTCSATLAYVTRDER